MSTCEVSVCWCYVHIDLAPTPDLGPSFWIAIGRETKDCEL